jgi:hypothetical protein
VTRNPPPEHYAVTGQIEPWDYIESHGLDFWEGNIIKYVTRAGRKHGASVRDDLIKARNYIDYLLEREEREERGTCESSG